MSTAKRGPDPKVSDEELLQAVQNVRFPMATAKDVAKQVPIKKKQVYNRLEDMVEAGKLKSRKVGSSAKLYWAAD